MLSNEEFKVYDFEAAKNMKKRTGRAVAWQKDPVPDSPELTKHEDEAMAVHNEPAKPKKPDSNLTKAAKFIGLMDPLP
jgi:hypothetical protein